MSESAQPWEQPDEQTKEAAEPIRAGLEKALDAIDTPGKAQALAERLAEDAEGLKAKEMAEQAPQVKGAAPAVQADIAARVVDRARTGATSEVDEAAAAIEAIAAEVSDLEGPAYEAVVAAVQDVTNPALKGEPEKLDSPRRYLRDVIMQRMSFFQKYDTALFIAINNGLHTPVTNTFFQQLSFIFNGGWAWIIGTALFYPFHPARVKLALKQISIPIWVAALGVEGPVKKYFRRRRPFIDVVRAIVVGKKPGNWSFPSGHAAAAFGGARMMSRSFPRLSALWYTIAGFVAFSRIYLGAHYPGDVLSGSAIGILLAEGARALMRRFGWWPET